MSFSFKKEKKENNQTPGVKHHSQLPLPAQPHTSAVDVGQFKDPQPAPSRVATLEEKVKNNKRIKTPTQSETASKTHFKTFLNLTVPTFVCAFFAF